MHVRQQIIGLLLTTLVATNVFAVDRLQDRRFDDSGKSRAGTTAKGGSGTLVELLVQLDNLQNEVKALRNQVEIQSHELNQLRETQRNMMRDTDARLSKLGQGGGTGRPASSMAPSPGVAKLPASKPEPAKPVVSKPAKPAPATSKASVQAQKDYDAAFQQLREGYYQKAIASFEAFLKQYPKHKLASNAQYWIAKSHYVTRNYKQALVDFDKTIKNYPRSSKIPDAMLNKGYTLYDLGRWAEARKALKLTAKRYAGSRTGKRAKKRLERMKKEGR
ncbi:MAG: tol-pal system protein YbgF [Proteobacteria bacterium]|nr:tol-pal system protein YbgF [Pseudomonadota bacterium]